MFLAAAVQLTCTSEVQRNRDAAERLIRRAAAYGARFIATPENTNYLGPHTEKVRLAEPVDGPTIGFFASLAAELGVYLLVGSFNEAAPIEGRCFNTSVLLGPDGKRVATYRKMHLFDVDVSPDVRFLESDTVVPGDRPVVAETELGAIGMTICYDLRFPELYRALTDAGARLLTIPSAFTLTTGKDHWEALVRARAIECQSWVIAPGQYGKHDDGGLRQSWGHSMIVDPWGHVVAMAADGEGLALAEIDLAAVERTRRGMPVARHRRV
ncbi:MAG: carbon-nitrogen hydrolase family protein [Myxococcota bacterium]